MKRILCPLNLRWIAPLLILGVGWINVQPGLPTGHSSRAATSSGAPDEEPRIVQGAELWARPGPHVGELLLLQVQFESESPSWNPLLTRFGPGSYRAFSAWAEEQLLWHEADFATPKVRVFAKRGGAAEWALNGAKRFARFELLCRVQSVFAGVPWVEVVAVKPRPRRMQEGSLLHAVRGMDFAKKGLWKAAMGEFERADSPGIPKIAHAELVRVRDLCRKKIPIQLGEKVDRW